MSAVDPGEARARADEIVEGFAPKDPPKPFKGLLDWIGDEVVQPVTEWFAETFEFLPEPLAWTLLIAAIGGVCYLIARYATGHVGSGARATTRQRFAADGADPAALEAEAHQAEAVGDYERALRLRFRAGLMRLDRDAAAIDYHDAVGTADVRTTIAVDDFDRLADRFDSVVYGPEVAIDDDCAEARRSWPRVVDRARR